MNHILWYEILVLICIYRGFNQKDENNKEKWFSQQDQMNNSPHKNSYFQNNMIMRETGLKLNPKMASIDRSRYNKDSYYSSNDQNNDDDGEQIKELMPEYVSNGKHGYICFWLGPSIFINKEQLLSIIEVGARRGVKRATYSREVTHVLNEWLEEHIHYPYPAEDERIELCRSTGLTRKQIRVWFINARKVKLTLINPNNRKQKAKLRDKKFLKWVIPNKAN